MDNFLDRRYSTRLVNVNKFDILWFFATLDSALVNGKEGSSEVKMTNWRRQRWQKHTKTTGHRR